MDLTILVPEYMVLLHLQHPANFELVYHRASSSSRAHGLIENHHACAGDSLMRQQFASLACLLKKVSNKGFSGKWDETNYTVQGTYYHKWGNDRKVQVSKQFIGDFTLKNGAQIIIRCCTPPVTCLSLVTRACDNAWRKGSAWLTLVLLDVSRFQVHTE